MMDPKSSRSYDFIGNPGTLDAIAPEGANLCVTEWTAQGTKPGQTPIPIAPLHIHHGDDEAWYVLKGKLGFRVGDKTVEAGPNDAVVVPKGTPHSFWNPGPETAQYLIMMTKRVRRLVDAIHEADSFEPEDMKRLFRCHQSELLD